jgi:3-oxoacyl-[acyl-carrier protein] reductase
MDTSPLNGRVALVTGASGGIGRAIAQLLAQAGADVAVGYGSHREPAESLAEELARTTGVRVTVVGGDLGDAGVPDQLVDATERELGPVDVLVPAAGSGQRALLEEVGLELWQRTHLVNVTAPFLLCRRLVPGMAERGFGRVLLVSSVAAFTGGIVGPHYASSKAALHGLVHSLAPTYAGHGVTVNALAPALIERTAMLPGNEEELAARVPVGRLGTPEEVAGLALAVLANGYVTNQVIGIDGGMFPR